MNPELITQCFVVTQPQVTEIITTLFTAYVIFKVLVGLLSFVFNQFINPYFQRIATKNKEKALVGNSDD